MPPPPIQCGELSRYIAAAKRLHNQCARPLRLRDRFRAVRAARANLLPSPIRHSHRATWLHYANHSHRYSGAVRSGATVPAHKAEGVHSKVSLIVIAANRIDRTINHFSRAINNAQHAVPRALNYITSPT